MLAPIGAAKVSAQTIEDKIQNSGFARRIIAADDIDAGMKHLVVCNRSAA